MSLSNYIYTGQGTVADIAELKRIIDAQPLDAEKIVKALTEHPQTVYRFKVHMQTDNLVRIIATDFCGNEDIISIQDVVG